MHVSCPAQDRHQVRSVAAHYSSHMGSMPDAQLDGRPHWLAGDQNQAAYELSRKFDNADWRPNPEYFRIIRQHIYQQHPVEMDWMATHANRQVKTYCSQYPDIESKGNCFTHHWGQTTDWGYVNPDFRNIRRVITHIEQTRARVIVVLPVWKHKVWYTRVMQHATRHMLLGCPADLYLPDDRGASRMTGPPSWDTMAVLLDFRQTT